MTKVSVVIPIFNAAETLPATIIGLQSQSFRDWRAVLVDDGSTDDSWAIATNLADQDDRLTVLRNPGKGPSAARNFGATVHPDTKIIAFCDADDIWHRHKLHDVVACLAQHLAHAVFGQTGFFHDNPARVRTWSRVPKSDVTLPALMGENPVCTLSNLSVRRDTFQALRGFREDMVHNEDLEFLIRLVGTGHRLRPIDAQHVFYRLSHTGLSADLGRMREGRLAALDTAAWFGFRPDMRAEAVHLRYLARRALRIGAPASTVRNLVLQGCRLHAGAFLLPVRRGGLIALAAAILPVLPKPLRHFLFAT